MIQIDGRSTKPLYEQIYMQIIKLISMNVYERNSKLPSIRELAVDLKVNPNTIQRAYQNLENDNVITSAKGKGYFVGNNENFKEIFFDNNKKKFVEFLDYLREIGFTNEEILELTEKELLANPLNSKIDENSEEV